MKIVNRCTIALAALVLVVVGLTAQACWVHETPAGYFEAKAEYARVLDRFVGGQNPNFRIAAIHGPIYALGQVLAPNSAEPLTEACLFNPAIIRTHDWSTQPELQSERGFKFGVQLPEIVSGVISELSDVGVKIESGSTAKFAFADVKQDTVNADQLKAAIRTVDCVDAIEGQQVTLVRGLVHARESVSSTKTFGADLQVKLLKNDTIKLSYDNEGNYAVEDDTPRPRFYILVDVEIVVSGLADAVGPADRREKITKAVREESTLVTENRPSDATVAAMGGVLPK